MRAIKATFITCLLKGFESRYIEHLLLHLLIAVGREVKESDPIFH